MTGKRAKGRIASDETFDEFLSGQGLLADAEELAIEELDSGWSLANDSLATGQDVQVPANDE